MSTVCREVNEFSISSGAEVAVFGWWFLVEGVDVDAAAVAASLDTVHATADWWSHGDNQGVRREYGTEVVMARRWAEVIDQDTGHVETSAPMNNAEVPQGFSSTHQLPAEVALCVSIRAATALRSGQGRFYLPPPAQESLTATGTFTNTVISNVATEFAAYYAEVLDSQGFILGTWSQKETAFTPAASINVGSIPDAQRRRRNKLVEIRESRTL